MQFIHLLRLAWDLRRLGIDVAIELPHDTEPSMTVRRTGGSLRVMVGVRGRKWAFIWGRRRAQWVAVFDENAANQIQRAILLACGRTP